MRARFTILPAIALAILTFLLGVAVISVLLFEPLKAAFLANSIFNSMILGVLLVGIIITLQVAIGSATR